MNQDVVQLWLNSTNVSQDDKNKILAMSPEEKAIAFADQPLAFGTAGIRAKMGPGTQFLNTITYYQMAMGYGRYLQEKFPQQKITVIVAHDNRNNGIEFSINVSDILTSLGINVVFFEKNDLTSTPIVSYAIRKIQAQGAVIVTASHNPKEDNGFKIYNETGAQVLPKDGARVSYWMPKVIEMINYKVIPNNELITYLKENIFDSYYSDCLEALIKTDVKIEKTFPIIFSGQHGTASKRLPTFLKHLGYTNVIPVLEQCEYDGNFTHTKTPNPENRDAWDLSLKYADKYNANVIIQVDPDADRFAIAIRHKGEWRFLTGNEMGIIYTYYVLKNRNFYKTPYVVSSYVSTNLIDRILTKYNGVVYRVGTGFKWMGAKINEIKDSQDFVVAFEEAIGALNSTINRDKDAYQAASLALEIYDECYKENRDLIDLLEDEIYKEFGTIYNNTVAFTFKESNWKILAKARLDKLLIYTKTKIGDRVIKEIKFNDVGDCVDWIFENDSWLRFRMSGTEPKFKVYYNLYGNNLNELQIEAKQINMEIKELLNL